MLSIFKFKRNDTFEFKSYVLNLKLNYEFKNYDFKRCNVNDRVMLILKFKFKNMV